MQLTTDTEVGGGRYLVEELLGQGGMAAVYRVRHAQLGTPLALKVLTSASPDQRDRLLREGRAQASLRHSNIVSVVDVVEIDGLAALVMEYIDGPSLDHVLKRQTLTAAQADHLMRGILAGVAAAHEQGFVHRDLKPGNVMLAMQRTQPVPRVADFGLVKHLAEGVESATRTGAMMGTPSYMAPEQIRDSGKVDARADVFSLGAIAYELLTGRRAFDGDDAFDTFEAIVRGRYTPIREVLPEVDARMAAVVEQALAVEPSERFDSAVEMEAAWGDAAPSLRPKEVWPRELLRRWRPEGSTPGFDMPSFTDEAPATYAVENDAVRTEAAAAPVRSVTTLAPATSFPEAYPQQAGWTRGQRFWAVVASLGAVFALALILVASRERVRPVFTVEGVPEGFYEDPADQARLERSWDAAMRLEFERGRQEVEPLLQAETVPVEVVLLWHQMRDWSYNSTRRRFQSLLRRVDPKDLGEDRGAAVCLRQADLRESMHAEGWTRDSSDEFDSRYEALNEKLRAWLVDHPTDVQSAVCHGALPWMDRADPRGTTPFVVDAAVTRALPDFAEARRRVDVLAEVDPHSVSTRALVGTVLMWEKDYDGALDRFESALLAAPSRLDLRRKAARLAVMTGHEASLRAHLRLATAEEWPVEIRAESVDGIAPVLIDAGRPQLVLDLAETFDFPAAVLNGNEVGNATTLYPDMWTVEQLEVLQAAYLRGPGPDASVVAVTSSRNALHDVEASLIVRGHGEVPEDTTRFTRRAQYVLLSRMEDAVARFERNPPTRTPAEGEWPPKAALSECRVQIHHGAFYALAGLPERAEEAFAAIDASRGCGGFADRRMESAYAAGQLALAAFARGAPKEAAPYVERYQELWPIAEDTMPLAQALAEYGVVTGPERVAWEDAQAK